MSALTALEEVKENIRNCGASMGTIGIAIDSSACKKVGLRLVECFLEIGRIIKVETIIQQQDKEELKCAKK